MKRLLTLGALACGLVLFASPVLADGGTFAVNAPKSGPEAAI